MDILKSIDTMWVLIATCLVFFMQAGFAMVETGFTRAKNAGNIIMKNLMDFSVGTLIFWIFGFGIMFGTDTFGLFGKLDFFSLGSYAHLNLGIPNEAFIIFQTVFCATAATIVSGAMAERTKFLSYLVYSLVISAVIYPVVGHWIWGGGWLSAMGFHDFAGSTVVHSVGGWAALVGAKIIGPRIGKYSQGESNVIPGHSITLGALGVFILWFGWFGFNPGSTLSMADPSIVGHIFMTTNLSAAAGALSAMTLTWMKNKKPDVGLTLNGALAGLVGITAGTDVVGLPAAVIIGLLSGILVIYVTEFIDQVLRIDDPVGAFAVHGACGVFGTVMVGVFATEGGLIFSGNASLLMTQIIGVGATGLWTVSTTYILFKAIDATIGLRVSKKEEILGLDLEEHGLIGYADFEIKNEKKAS
jgi:Amt family ammonium transporter